APEILRFAQDDRQDTSQVRSQEVLSPNLYWRGSNVRSIEFTTDEGSCSLTKIHCSGLAKWVGSAEIVKLVLLQHGPDFHRSIIRRPSISQPLFNCWSKRVCVDLFYFQSAGCEERQEHADGKCPCMRGVAELFEAVLVSGSCRVFTHHKIFDCNDALY